MTITPPLAELKGADFAVMAEIVRKAKDGCGIDHARLVAGQWSYPAADLLLYCEWDVTGRPVREQEGN